MGKTTTSNLLLHTVNFSFLEKFDDRSMITLTSTTYSEKGNKNEPPQQNKNL
jgi:hypothetical protein